jgi:outer membrane murein-binding lipoprotein Lpp
MGRILLIIAAVIAALFLLGPLMGLVFSLVKWGLIIGAVVLGVMFLSKWAKRT